MPIGKSLQRVLDPNAVRSIGRANVENAFGVTLPPPLKEREFEKAKRMVGQIAAQNVVDGVLGGVPVSPEKYSGGIAARFGSGRLNRHYNESLWDAYAQAGDQLVDDNPLSRTFTGSNPSYVLPMPLESAGMGTASPVAATLFTPRQALENMTGDPSQAKRILDRIALRNSPDGADNAAVYASTPFQEDMNTAWTAYRSLHDDGFDVSQQRAYANPMGRTIITRAGDDYDTYPKGALVPRQRILNTGQHEAVHTILHGQVPSLAHVEAMKTRPAVTDIRQGLLKGQQARYLSSHGDELGNLLFHTKRNTEIVNPKMRDVGVDQDTLDGFLDHVRQYEPADDPIINLKGHPREGEPAHGYDAQMRALKNILEAAGPDAMQDIKDINFKTGQTTPLRNALLA